MSWAVNIYFSVHLFVQLMMHYWMQVYSIFFHFFFLIEPPGMIWSLLLSRCHQTFCSGVTNTSIMSPQSPVNNPRSIVSFYVLNDRNYFNKLNIINIDWITLVQQTFRKVSIFLETFVFIYTYLFTVVYN